LCRPHSYVEQEIVGDDTTAIQSVLQADVWRHHLLTQERELNDQLNSAEVPESEKDEMTTKLGEIQKKLIDIEAESGPARAAQLLVGLGFEVEDQQKPTRAFSGGWRCIPLLLASEVLCRLSGSRLTIIS
jgi:ATP-binding cassette subfamily F protein 3